MALDAPDRERIQSLIDSQDVVLFMKGVRHAPRCGFSATVVQILDTLVPEYATIDILADSELHQSIKTFSSWPTIPQLYIKGEFVGGCDIVKEMLGTGALTKMLGIELGDTPAPAIEIAEPAAELLLNAAAQGSEDGRKLHIAIDARFQARFSLAPAGDGDILVEATGVTLFFDALSASRADGLKIYVIDTPGGPRLQIDNPNAPPVNDLDPSGLKKMLDTDEPFELLDVRTQEERDRASIPGSKLLTGTEAKRLMTLPRDTLLVFFCHLGERSAVAAADFATRGFVNVHNVVGGIDEWSQKVDPEVPRY
jgi:monothiol glutaredoxin